MRRGLKRRLTRTLVVHTTDGQTVRGILTGDYADLIVLSSPAYLQGANETQLGGDVLILRERIGWMQDVTGVEKSVHTLPPPR